MHTLDTDWICVRASVVWSKVSLHPSPESVQHFKTDFAVAVI
jgi:hypothetical protein